MIDSDHLAEKPAIRVPFAQPFWALRPSLNAEEDHHVVEACCEVRCHRFFDRCQSFCELVGMLIAIAKQEPVVLKGARLALCALRFHVHDVQTALVEAMLSEADLGCASTITAGALQLGIGSQCFHYGPRDFPFHQLGVAL